MPSHNALLEMQVKPYKQEEFHFKPSQVPDLLKLLVEVEAGRAEQQRYGENL